MSSIHLDYGLTNTACGHGEILDLRLHSFLTPDLEIHLLYPRLLFYNSVMYRVYYSSEAEELSHRYVTGSVLLMPLTCVS